MNDNATGQGPVERMVRRYPLDVAHVSTDEGAYCMSKGHHSDAEFLAEVRSALGEEDLSDWGAPRREWWRVVPAPTETYRLGVYHPAAPGARGAFPVTVIDY